MMLSEKEREIVLLLFKDFTKQYNASIISRIVLMSPRGALKALKNLEKQQFVTSIPFGKAIQYKIKFSALIKKNIELLLLEEAEFQYKRWVEEFKSFSEAEILILFGSVLIKDKKYNDVDLIIVFDKKKYNSLMKKIDEKNNILLKKIHPVLQTINDLKNNLIEKNTVVLEAMRAGVVLKGQDKLVEVISNVSGK